MAPNTTINPIKRENSPQWPQTSFAAMDRRSRSATPNTHRKRQTSFNPRLRGIDEEGEDDGPSAGSGMKNASEALTEMAIGHMLIDGPHHRLYQKHVNTVILAFRSNADGLKSAVAQLKESAQELDLEENAPSAIGALTIAWYDSDLSGHAPRPPRYLRASAEIESIIQDDRRSTAPTEASIPAIETELEDDHALIARGVDMFWSSDAMTRLLPPQLHEAVQNTFKDTQTLFMVNFVAKQEFEACLSNQFFGLKDAVKKATIAWAILKTADRAKMGHSPECTSLWRLAYLRVARASRWLRGAALELQAQANGEFPEPTMTFISAPPNSTHALSKSEKKQRRAERKGMQRTVTTKSERELKRAEKKRAALARERERYREFFHRACFITKSGRKTKMKHVWKHCRNVFAHDGIESVKVGLDGFFIVFEDRECAKAPAKQAIELHGTKRRHRLAQQ